MSGFFVKELKRLWKEVTYLKVQDKGKAILLQAWTHSGTQDF
jgi:hypothetical protein